MLTARRQSDSQTVTAYVERKENGPFYCLECGDPVILKTGTRNVSHFAHENPIACKFATGESDAHRHCKQAIYEALIREPHVRDVALELPLGENRPDVFARIKGVPVAIEVQLSSLSVDTIMRRTIDYARNGIHVLWLLQWTPKLDETRYAPRQWEKWLHACYFGRVYYWIEGLTVVSYRFEPSYTSVPRKTWHSEAGKRMTGGGYSRKLKRHRMPVRERTLNIVTDFAPKQRYWWEGDGVKVPDAKLFIQA